jgi:hypothetical protein
MKKCNKCYEIKSLDEFHKSNKNKKTGRTSQCKICARDYGKEYRAVNKQKCLETSRNYYQNNKEHKKAYLKTRKEYYRKYVSHRRKFDINYKIRDRIRGRIGKAIKKQYKVSSAVVDLGCSIEEFKTYIESRFYINDITGESMDWNNWSKHGWHLDHIIPLDSFDLTDLEQFKKACHYTNLQPLWAKDNLQKANKILERI